jgi:hypothetical protein
MFPVFAIAYIVGFAVRTRKDIDLIPNVEEGRGNRHQHHNDDDRQDGAHKASEQSETDTLKTNELR